MSLPLHRDFRGFRPPRFGRSGGGGALELPLALGVDYWWDARRTDLIGLVGPKVASFACRITGATFAQAATNQPVWNATDADFNGSPSVEFDKTLSERLIWADGGQLGFLSDGSGGTVVAVRKNIDTGVLFCNGGTTSPSLKGLVFTNTGATTQGGIVSNGSGTYVVNHNIAFSKIPEAVGFRFDTSITPNYKINVQGFVASGAANGVPSGPATFSSAMGKQGNSAVYISDKICQILLWKRYLSDAEIAGVFSWARGTFGVSS